MRNFLPFCRDPEDPDGRINRVDPEPIENYLLRRAERAEAELARLRRMLAALDQMAADQNPLLGDALRQLHRVEARLPAAGEGP